MPLHITSLEALHDAEYGSADAARQKAATLKHPRNPFVRDELALTYAFIGDAARSKSLTDELNREYPSDTVLQFTDIPADKALILLHEKKANEAIAALEPSRKYELGSSGSAITYLSMYARGLAYLQQRDGEKGAAEFKRILDHPGLNSVSSYLPLAQLNLGRAYAQQNNVDKARIAYQNFFGMWKDADPDIAVLVAAKSEYAKLH